MKTNTVGTLKLSEEAIAHLQALNSSLASKLIHLNDTIVNGFIDLMKTTTVHDDLSIYQFTDKKKGCYLQFYIEIDNQIVLLNLDLMENCTLNINQV